jgi:hypothetical protein
MRGAIPRACVGVQNRGTWDTASVATTRKKLDAPVRNGEWGLGIDRLDLPATVTILRYADKSRHTRSHSAVGHLAFHDDLDLLTDQIAANSEMSAAHARSLARDLIAKVNSPRARAHSVEQS